MGKLKNILKQYHIEYQDYSAQTLAIRACDICKPTRSYLDWRGDPNKVYADWDKNLLGKLQPFITNKHLVIINCDDCCDYGDW